MEKKPYWVETIERSYFFKNGQTKIKELFKIPIDEELQELDIRYGTEIYIQTCKRIYDRRKI